MGSQLSLYVGYANPHLTQENYNTSTSIGNGNEYSKYIQIKQCKYQRSFLSHAYTDGSEWRISTSFILLGCCGAYRSITLVISSVTAQLTWSIANPIKRICPIVFRRVVLSLLNTEIDLSQEHAVTGMVAAICNETKMREIGFVDAWKKHSYSFMHYSFKQLPIISHGFNSVWEISTQEGHPRTMRETSRNKVPAWRWAWRCVVLPDTDVIAAFVVVVVASGVSDYTISRQSTTPTTFWKASGWSRRLYEGHERMSSTKFFSSFNTLLVTCTELLPQSFVAVACVDIRKLF